jgi:D-alanyl-D-alanine carboxypeptidase
VNEYRNDTAAANRYWYDNNFDTHKRRENSKRQIKRGFIGLFLTLCTGIAAMALAIGLFSGNSPLSFGQPPYARIPSGSVITNGINAGGAVNTQNYANETAWNLTLVNKWNPIPQNYELELTELANGELVDERIYPALQEMFDAARNANIYPVVASGYRTAEEQQRLLDEKIAAYEADGYSAAEAISNAQAWVAVSGTSEHQLGIAVDINADGIHSTGYEVYEWLNQNSYKFGFICRYPGEKTEITGIIDEPWHYRYVGTEAAAEIYHQGICLEEYLARIA